jgi:hypothetical protein
MVARYRHLELLEITRRMPFARVKSAALREIFELALLKLKLTRQLGILIQEHGRYTSSGRLIRLTGQGFTSKGLKLYH